jgi:hypothetical protein
MATYIKLFGPSLSKGLEKLEEFVETSRIDAKETISPEQRAGRPVWARTGDTLFDRSGPTIGTYDFVIEWKEYPSIDKIKELIRGIDAALAGTGCRYTVTTF